MKGIFILFILLTCLVCMVMEVEAHTYKENLVIGQTYDLKEDSPLAISDENSYDAYLHAT